MVSRPEAAGQESPDSPPGRSLILIWSVAVTCVVAFFVSEGAAVYARRARIQQVLDLAGVASLASREPRREAVEASIRDILRSNGVDGARVQIDDWELRDGSVRLELSIRPGGVGGLRGFLGDLPLRKEISSRVGARYSLRAPDLRDFSAFGRRELRLDDPETRRQPGEAGPVFGSDGPIEVRGGWPDSTFLASAGDVLGRDATVHAARGRRVEPAVEAAPFGRLEGVQPPVVRGDLTRQLGLSAAEDTDPETLVFGRDRLRRGRPTWAGSGPAGTRTLVLETGRFYRAAECHLDRVTQIEIVGDHVALGPAVILIGPDDAGPGEREGRTPTQVRYRGESEAGPVDYRAVPALRILDTRSGATRPALDLQAETDYLAPLADLDLRACRGPVGWAVGESLRIGGGTRWRRRVTDSVLDDLFRPRVATPRVLP